LLVIIIIIVIIVIIRETKDIESGASTSFSTPHKERPKKSPLATLDDFNESVLRRTINDFYIVEKQRPALKKTLDFQGCICTLKKIILKLGFRWKKTKNIESGASTSFSTPHKE
jgi:hypothetical protein